ncbi:2-hydroxychromene-2-carboxylate isomerase [Henriciella barbarensis]|uniref:2-hydroxychromene-2-carboxylate isomerase n=1 Tax=Henriciella barbarensis TaxID=86342 RepID=A0A399QTZ0_9PROT|nr:DsbA family protein [Henriciella barbarensis]RIJ21655.1 2-hydroxychromene-2-carboxylate isomerase [Henriciella barbarensis]
MRTVDYFHDTADPYSDLTSQILKVLCERYNIVVKPHLVSPPPDWAAPDRQRLIDYSRIDAARLASKAGLSFTDPGHQPSKEAIETASGALAAAINDGQFAAAAAPIGKWLWTGSGREPDASLNPDLLFEQGDRLRDELGHYLGGTFHYGGEWYWGIDRLHYLEARLRDEGAVSEQAPDSFIFPPPAVVDEPIGGGFKNAPDLHFYLSFRSPYTAISVNRVKALADAYGANLKLRFVLPMVMRGMQVPRAKGRYIIQDTAREARRLTVPFGKICDPVGEPVERGYSILPWAIEQGQGFAFTKSFLSGVWAEGIDAGTDKGLRTITERAGLDWGEARTLIGKDHWKAEAEDNRREMMSLGLWGVPSFRFGEVSAWGQDRLWVIEDAMKASLSAVRS